MPTKITDALRDFCHELAPGADPVYLTPRPTRGAEVEASFNNVKTFAWPHWLTGRSTQPGWLIWQWPGAFLAAQAHCVARMEDGTLRDVTPCPISDRVLFLPDDKVPAPTKDNPYTAQTRSRALTTDPLVTKMIAATTELEGFYLANIKPGINIIGPDVYRRMSELELHARRLRQALVRRTDPEIGFVSKKKAA